MHRVLLISTYELGHQPFGLASPAAWLMAAGADVSCLDLAVQPFDEEVVAEADLIAFYLPMHTATQLAVQLIPRVKSLNPKAHLCCYGLYAPTNESTLRQLGAQTLIGGEFESELTALYKELSAVHGQGEEQQQMKSIVSMERQRFLIPNRAHLPDLNKYATLRLPDGRRRQTGYTEASRGCKHRCRHCPIVPIYNGRFRIVQADVVLADIRQQVEAGAEHITFGDPDFLNGPGHAIPIIKALHREFPDLTYDVTIKIEHLLKYDHLLPELKESGCLFVTSAVEAVNDDILDRMDKGHTRDDFIRAATRLKELDLTLNPTFVAFTPWTTPIDYLEMLATINELELVEHVSPIQYAIRLLIPASSRLLELPEVRALVGEFDQTGLTYPWQHPDPQMDELYKDIYRLVQQMVEQPRALLFERVWQAVRGITPELEGTAYTERRLDLLAQPVPQLSESWY